jgi:hypothetical protein
MYRGEERTPYCTRVSNVMRGRVDEVRTSKKFQRLLTEFVSCFVIGAGGEVLARQIRELVARCEAMKEEPVEQTVPTSPMSPLLMMIMRRGWWGCRNFCHESYFLLDCGRTFSLLWGSSCLMDRSTQSAVIFSARSKISSASFSASLLPVFIPSRFFLGSFFTC